MFVKPKNGLSVRCPVKGLPLPAAGAEVPDNIFWRRRITDGDVEVVEPESADTDTKTTEPAKAVTTKKGSAE